MSEVSTNVSSVNSVPEANSLIKACQDQIVSLHRRQLATSVIMAVVFLAMYTATSYLGIVYLNAHMIMIAVYAGFEVLCEAMSWARYHRIKAAANGSVLNADCIRFEKACLSMSSLDTHRHLISFFISIGVMLTIAISDTPMLVFIWGINAAVNVVLYTRLGKIFYEMKELQASRPF